MSGKHFDPPPADYWAAHAVVTMRRPPAEMAQYAWDLAENIDAGRNMASVSWSFSDVGAAIYDEIVAVACEMEGRRAGLATG